MFQVYLSAPSRNCILYFLGGFFFWNFAAPNIGYFQKLVPSGSRKKLSRFCMHVDIRIVRFVKAHRPAAFLPIELIFCSQHLLGQCCSPNRSVQYLAFDVQKS